MKKLLKTLACFAVAALVGASAFAAAGWVGAGAIYVGENAENGVWYYADQHGSTSWCSGPFQDADLGSFTSLSLGGQVQLWDSPYNGDWGWGSTAKMYYIIDGGEPQLITLNYYKYEDHNNFFQAGGEPMVPTDVSLEGLAPGTHTLGVFFDDYDSLQTTTTNTATFTIPRTQTVTLDLNYDGAANPFDTFVAVAGEAYKVGGIPSPTRENYRFRGWFTDPDDGEGTRIRGYMTVPDDAEPTLTLFAHWEHQRQTVTFDANDGGAGAELLKATAKFDCGGEYSGAVFTMKGATWANHKFLGWYDEDGNPVVWGDVVTSDTTRTLYAHWRQYRQTVTFMPNADGVTLLKETAKFDCGGTYSGAVFTMKGATRDGYKFLGWYDEDTGERVWWGSDVTSDFDRTLYAHWRKVAAVGITGFSFSPRAARAARSVTTTNTDILTAGADSLNLGGSYGLFSNKTANSDAVYAGNAMKSSQYGNSIQLRSTGGVGIITTASGGKPAKVTVDWNSGTTSGRTLNVYGSDSAYTTASNLFDNATQGTLIGTIKNPATELTITNDFPYIGMRSASSAMYLNSIEIQWTVEEDDPPPSTEPSVTLEASATEVPVNGSVTITATAENFTPDGWIWFVGNDIVSETGAILSLDTSEAGTYVVTAWGYVGDPEDPDDLVEPDESVTITVNAPPPPSVTVDPSEATVRTGATLTITATAENFSGPVTWKWYVDNDEDTAAGNTSTYTVDTTAAGIFSIVAEATYGDEGDLAEAIVMVQAPHAITVTAGEHGSASADKATAYAGETVTLTVTPATGYTTDTITVNNGTVSVTDNSFTMPDAAANVSVTFKEKPAGFEKITSLADLVPGEYVITGVKDAANNEEYAMKAEISTTSTKYILRRTDAVTIEDGAVTDADDDIIWTLEKNDSDQWTIRNSAIGYVGYVASGNSAGAESTPNDDNRSRWTISLNSDGDGTFAVVNVKTTARNLRYNTNSGQERFACYQASGSGLTGSALNFYKKPSAARTQTVTLDLNYDGADNPFDTFVAVVGQVYKVGGIPSPTRANYRFRGWFTDPDDGEGTRIRGYMTVPDDAEPTLTLFAHWEHQRQTVTFDANDGGAGAELLKATAKFDCGGEYSGAVFTMKGATWANHKFLGWYDEDGNPVVWGDVVTSDTTRTLYAHWRQYRQTVTFMPNADGVTLLKETAKFDCGGTYSGAVFTMKGATRDGYKFLGWYDEDTGERVWWGSDVTSDSTRTLYAHWRKQAAAAITGFSVAPRAARLGARAAGADTVECTLWFWTVAGSDYDLLWTPSLLGDWEILKSWTADTDGETSVTVEIPADSATGFFRLMQVFD